MVAGIRVILHSDISQQQCAKCNVLMISPMSSKCGIFCHTLDWLNPLFDGDGTPSVYLRPAMNHA